MEVQQLLDDIEASMIEADRCQAEANKLERLMKRTHAILMLKEVGAVELRKAAALTSENYIDIEDRYIEASTRCQIARTKADVNRLRFEAWRTVQATERAAMRLV